MDLTPITPEGPAADLEALLRLRVAESLEHTPEVDPPGDIVDACSDIVPTAGLDRRGLLARDASGVAVGYALLWSRLTSNQHLLEAEVYVDAEHRRRGVGSTLVDAVLTHAEADGRTVLELGVKAGSVGATYARALGATAGLDELRSTLDVAALDPADTDALAGAATPGYELVRWQERCPDEFLHGYVAVNDAMNTAPRGDLSLEDHSWTVDELRSSEARRAKARVRSYTIAARRTDTGEFGGFTELIVPAARPATAFQEDTAVVPGHRGHGLGLVMKTSMLSWLRSAEPQLRVIQTWNAASNEHMLRVNRRLGFVARDQWEIAEVEVATARKRLSELTLLA